MSKLIRKFSVGGSVIRSVNIDKHTVEAVISDESIDRYDEIIRVDAYRKSLRKFMQHPVLLSSHRYGDLRNQLGEWKRVKIEGKKVVGVAEYYVGMGNPEADWGFMLAQKGLAAFSVGFIPIKSKPLVTWEEYMKAKDEGKKIARREYTEVELVETSQVLIPANANALQTDGIDESIIKSLGTDVAFDYEQYLEKIDKRFMLQVPAEYGDSFEDWEKQDKAVEEETEAKDVEEEFVASSEEEVEAKDAEEELETKPETTDSYHHIPVKSKSMFAPGSFRTIDISKKRGIKAVIGKLKSDPKGSTHTQKFLFDVNKWTMEEAKSWVKAHNKSVDEELIQGGTFDMEIEKILEDILAKLASLEDGVKSLSEDFKAKIAGVESTIKESREFHIGTLETKGLEGYVEKMIDDDEETEAEVTTINPKHISLIADELRGMTHKLQTILG